MSKIIRVLIVDDSAYVRKVVRQMLSRSPFIEVVGTAHDGKDALEQIEKLKPDVVTLDLIMPEMEGVEFLKQQMAKHPIPVVVVSIADEGGERVLAALDAGAVDFVQKPTALATDKMYDISDELIEKVKAAAHVPLNRLPVQSPSSVIVPEKPTVSPPVISQALEMIVIGISTGGPQALAYAIPQLPADFPLPIAVVLHMPIGYTKMYAERLNGLSALEVIEAAEGDVVRPGRVMIAPAGRHLTFIRHVDGQVLAHLEARPFDMLHRPSVDVLFQSAAEVYGPHLLGVVMTGMGSDGKQGCAWIKSHGGVVYTEDESSCVVYGMPRSVVEAGLSDRRISLQYLPSTLINLALSGV
ncbi:chemotaxis response regulator protein-glutamate methylesterase [Spirulina subsalsa FACHB-351]|uniref:Protein-glutamate methylesterase/protein-glutamine glutaminase n=1 Tax=Spirulina subsalsa FACHB-351 TaxID=234711 RepID=A0ABT3L8Z4_9CYAN|nr:chemotaxis response regulator protein-glutamate methylesterase [Spirulina subsalsa]MCW6037981.1 chemotaxis response regulator protein-glutamate methylesterase [Spirulina subsalsa FACHB-351]